MATVVTKSNVYSESRENILAILDDRSYVADPISSTVQNRKFIYSRQPDVKGKDFKGYPFIILYPVDPEEDDSAKSVDKKSKKINWDFVIEVVASDRTKGREGKGLADMDAISNDIFEAFQSETVKKILRGNLLFDVTIKSGGNVQEPLADELVYRRTILLSITNKMRVSS